MANQSTGRFELLHYDPGNPEFPTLPDGITSLHIIEIGRAPGLAIRQPLPDNQLPKNSADAGLNFGDWFLDGLWRQPDPVDFGNITASKQRQVTIHNTARSAVSLTAIDVSNIVGLSVISPGSLPTTIEAFDTITVTFEIALAGDSSFDAQVFFTIDGVSLPTRMIGRRIIIFNTVPERPILEQVSWLTDNMVSVDGTEQAFSLRRAPRSSVGLVQRFTDNLERTRQLSLIHAAGFLRFGVQLWWQARVITSPALSTDLTIQVDTQSMEIEVGSDVSFVLPDESVVEGEVESFTTSTLTLSQAVGVDLPAKTIMMPLQYGYIKRSVAIETHGFAVEDIKTDFTLLEYSDIGALDLAYFATHPVDGVPIISYPLAYEGNTRKGGLDQTMQVLDSITGDQAVFRQEPLARPGQSVLVYCHSLADQHAWRQFLHYIRGSWKTFYIPTGTNDLPLSSAFTLGGNQFNISSIGLESLIGTGQAPRRDIQLTIDGVVYYRRITNISDNGTIETITVDSIVPGTGTVDPSLVSISWLSLSRLVGDVATFKHLYFGESELRFNVRGVIE